ncbi:hypothetical protein EVAR_82483_1 [Eumeta japonica]|uniref:Uncharacterized protein n=1 Tax=Eumeta variegata TaxID=151549 RepID=A0A4C1UW88_EUMVA|nr:hypothetical protein EVAR_82483_1 [Eumeta japonica]
MKLQEIATTAIQQLPANSNPHPPPTRTNGFAQRPRALAPSPPEQPTHALMQPRAMHHSRGSDLPYYNINSISLANKS